MHGPKRLGKLQDEDLKMVRYEVWCWQLEASVRSVRLAKCTQASPVKFLKKKETLPETKQSRPQHPQATLRKAIDTVRERTSQYIIENNSYEAFSIDNVLFIRDFDNYV